MRRFLSDALLDGWYFYVLPHYRKMQKIFRICLGTSFGLGIFAAVVFSFFGSEVGYLEASYDLWRDHYEIRTYSHRKSHEASYRGLLKPYGIMYRRVSISAFNPFTTNHLMAYNRTMKKAIRSDLGLDVESLLRLFGVLEAIEKGPEPETWTTPAAFYEEIAPMNQDPSGKDADEPRILMQTQKPGAGSPDHFRLSKCHTRLRADFTGDSVSEDTCLRELRFKEWDLRFIKRSVVVDVYADRERVLRQELDLGAFWHEKYLKIIDADADGRKELVTTVKFGPRCAGCGAHRIYQFEQDRFEPVLHLFGIDPDNPFIQTTLNHLSGYEDRISAVYRHQTETDFPCGLYQNCMVSPPWLVDIDADQRPEAVFLVQQPYGGNSEKNRRINIVVADISANGNMTNIRFQSTDIACCDGFVDLLGFIKTRDDRIHLLVNFAYAGTSVSYPVLHIFELYASEVRPIGEFAGFYEHVISERLLDLDKDGNTEIVFVEDAYWPPGGSHSEMVPIYGIAKYINGQYKKANQDFNRAYRQLNRHMFEQ